MDAWCEAIVEPARWVSDNASTVIDWMLGQAYQDGANPASAINFFGRVLKRRATDQDARFQRGLIAFALGRTQQAADEFARILAELNKHARIMAAGTLTRRRPRSSRGPRPPGRSAGTRSAAIS